MQQTFSKPPAGSYKSPLIIGLKMIGMTTESEAIANGGINFGIVATFSGAVNTIPELTQPFIAALKAVPQTDITGYYIIELEAGRVMPCNPSGAYVYDTNNQTQVAFVAAQGNVDLGHIYFQ